MAQFERTLAICHPTNNSTLYKEPLVLNQTATVKARTFFTAGGASSVNEYNYQRVTLREAETLSGLQAGIHYRYYENDAELWQQLPDFAMLKPKSGGITDQIDLSKAQREENITLVFEGYFKAPQDGIFNFYTISDDGSKLFIAEQEVVSNDFLHGMETKSGQIALKAGYHPLEVLFFQSRGGKGLEVQSKLTERKEKRTISEFLFIK